MSKRNNRAATRQQPPKQSPFLTRKEKEIFGIYEDVLDLLKDEHSSADTEDKLDELLKTEKHWCDFVVRHRDGSFSRRMQAWEQRKIGLPNATSCCAK